MTTNIKLWSTTAANNNATPPAGAPEGMAPSGVNDCIRYIMAAVRSWFESASWIDFGYAGLTYFDGTNVTVTGDQTAQATIGRRIRAIGTTPFKVYGTITASAYNAPNTKITIVWDGAGFDNTVSEIAFGPENLTKPVDSGGVNFRAATMPYATISDPPATVIGVPTGAVMGYALSKTVAPTGYVFIGGRTIGNAASGATERADADTATLFAGLWAAFANTELPIQDSTGTASIRGVDAATDYAANKRLPTLDARGRVLACLDNLGGTTAGRITFAGGNFDGTVMGKAGGAENHVLTTGEVPNLTVPIPYFNAGALPGGPHNVGTSDASNTTANTATTGGGGGSHINVQPTLVLPFVIKL